MNSDQHWMEECLILAKKAISNDEVPVGAIVVYQDTIIGRGWNQSISTNDPSAHAEIVALREAGEKLCNYRLCGATMYVSLEPCIMCAGAIIQARLAKLIYATSDLKTGACGSVFNLLQTKQLNHQVEVIGGILAQESRSLLQNFFKIKRAYEHNNTAGRKISAAISRKLS